MPAPHPVEFRQRAVELARTGDKPVAVLAKDLGISESCLRNWMTQADTDDGRGGPDRLTSAEKKELAELRRRNRQLEMENDILKRAAAYFAKGPPNQNRGCYGALFLLAGGGVRVGLGGEFRLDAGEDPWIPLRAAAAMAARAGFRAAGVRAVWCGGGEIWRTGAPPEKSKPSASGGRRIGSGPAVV